MTRKRSRRELTDAVDDLTPGTDRDPFAEYDAKIAYRCQDGWVDGDGDPLPDDPDAVVRYGGVTMERSRAEREGYEILGTVEDAHGDYVTVPWDYGDQEGPQ